VTADFDTGQRFGAYLLGKLLGRGGMGVVYQAQHVHLGRTVALKLLAPELSENEDFRARFLRESRMAAALDHPSIVTVYDAGDVNGVLYLAMRFVRGTDLSALLAQRSPLGPAETVGILGQVAAALDAAHAAGLVHRDVKPANVMIEGDRCYLADFGLTKRTMGNTRVLTAAGQFLGTVDYVAPEQIEARDDVDGRADVYALGCVLFECLTGARPYPRDSQVAVLYAQLREPPPRPTELRPDLPVAIDRVVATAMAKSPDARYASCAELVEAARAALQPEPAVTLPLPAAVEPEPLPAAAVPAPIPTPVPVPLPLPAEPPTLTLPEPRGNRRQWVTAAALGTAAIAAAVIAVLASTGGSETKPKAVRTVVAPTPNGPRVAGAPIRVGSHPYGVVFRDGDLWVANNADSTVTRVVPETGRTSTITVGAGPFDLASNTHGVWAADSRDDSVTRIDTRTGRADRPIAVGRTPFFLTAEDHAVYVSNGGSDSVSVIDPKTGAEAVPPIPVGSQPRGITTSPDAVWVANRGDGTVTRIANNRPTRTIQVGSRPANIAYGGDAVWVANEGSDTVSRIDVPSKGKRVTTARVGRAPFGIVFGQGYAWVTNAGEDSVMRLDPASGKPVGDPIPVPGKPVSVTVGAGAIWVTANGASTLTRIQP
jgi:YVTN family beta-propeller protein